MEYLDVRLPLSGRPIIVAGTGALAEAVVARLDGATIRRLTDSLAFDPTAYDGAAFCIVVSGDDVFAQAAARAARTAGLLVCAEGRPALSDFTLAQAASAAPPAEMAAIDTAVLDIIPDAASETSDSDLGTQMAAFLDGRPGVGPPPGAGRIAALLQRVQAHSRDAEDAERREALQQILHGPAARAAADGDMEMAERHVLAALERFREESTV